MVEQSKSRSVVMEGADVERALADMADRIAQVHKTDLSQVAFVGIRTRGVYLAQRLAGIIERTTGTAPACASMDVTLYRDDVAATFPPMTAEPTWLEFDVTNAVIVLVDDVLFRGRTIRAALDQIVDFGRPAKIELAVLIDRGHRELPIQPDYVGLCIETDVEHSVKVSLTEQDGVDMVEILDSATATRGSDSDK